MLSQAQTHERAYALVKVALGVVLIALCAQITVPLEPVPITLQTVALLLIGITYQPKEAVATVATYLMAGAAGAPIFAMGMGGLAVFARPSAGFLIGFLAAAMAMGFLKERQVLKGLPHLILLSFVGSIVPYFFGIPYLATFIGLTAAIQLGFMPFILSGIVKAAFVVSSLRLMGYDKA